MFWGRAELAEGATSVSTVLFRNRAKVTVENKATNFSVTGYALCNSRLSGPWLRLIRLQHLCLCYLGESPTLPLGSVQKVDQTVADWIYPEIHERGNEFV
ncbi:MAG: hypothetical protein ACLU4J_02795 [Butyricimonas paravirosa]